MNSPDSPAIGRRTPDPRMPVRARHLLRVGTVWLVPMVVGAVVVSAMTALYIGSVVDPLAHLRGLPVAVVNEDRGATIGVRHVDLGRQVEEGLVASPAVTGKLQLTVETLRQAERAMGDDGAYATLVVPPDFTTALLSAAGVPAAHATVGAVPEVEILTNERAGTVGVSLATGILQDALAVASHKIGRGLSAMVPARSRTGATAVLLTSPVTVATPQYRPLPDNAALGLSAFYMALLTLMCGFLGATIVNSIVDSALGYATSEIGPRWRQRKPLPINRWQTLLIKWAVVTPLAGLLTALVLLVAGWGLGMDAPHPLVLWLFMWLCAASVGIGTIVLFAAAGSFGPLIAVLLFVYAGLASAGGTVPIEALPGVLRALSNVEPLRQVLAGTRSIMYFGAKADAGLTRGALAAGLGLLIWLAIGTVVVRWYDRRHLYRLQPDLLAQVDRAVRDYKSQQAVPAPTTSSTPTPTSSFTADPVPAGGEADAGET